MASIDLLDVTTADGLLLTGALYPAAVSSHKLSGIDAVLMVHGNGVSFYSPYQRDFAARLAAMGVAVLAANNRGNGMVTPAVRPAGGPPAYIGTSLERIDECVPDLDAWLDLLRSRGHERILLWAHSRGAVKAAYYLATTRVTGVAAAVLSSPPLFSHQRWLASARGEEFKGMLARCADAVTRGEPDTLVPVTVPLPYLSGAAQYLDTYGPQERYNLLALLERIDIPVLATTGSIESTTMLPYIGLPELLDAHAAQTGRFEHFLLEGADHVYTGRRVQVLEQVRAWLARQELGFTQPS